MATDVSKLRFLFHYRFKLVLPKVKPDDYTFTSTFVKLAVPHTQRKLELPPKTKPKRKYFRISDPDDVFNAEYRNSYKFNSYNSKNL